MNIFQNTGVTPRKAVKGLAFSLAGAVGVAGMFIITQPLICAITPENGNMRASFRKAGLIDNWLMGHCPPDPPPAEDFFDNFRAKIQP